jgi:hypothetical protein
MTDGIGALVAIARLNIRSVNAIRGCFYGFVFATHFAVGISRANELAVFSSAKIIS